MTNIKVEVVSSSTSYVLGVRKEAPHARARSPRLATPRRAGPGGAGRWARVRDVRVNGPPKSGPSPCGGAASFCSFYFWLLVLW